MHSCVTRTSGADHRSRFHQGGRVHGQEADLPSQLYGTGRRRNRRHAGRQVNPIGGICTGRQVEIRLMVGSRARFVRRGVLCAGQGSATEACSLCCRFLPGAKPAPMSEPPASVRFLTVLYFQQNGPLRFPARFRFVFLAGYICFNNIARFVSASFPVRFFWLIICFQ